MPHILIVESPYYKDVCDALAEGAIAALTAAGASFDRVQVPGALEIPPAIAYAHWGEQDNGVSYDGFLALGCVIRGETSHYDIVCEQSASGLTQLSVEDHVPIGNAILTVENHEQAMVRALPSKKNKGKDAVDAVLALIALKQRFNLGEGAASEAEAVI